MARPLRRPSPRRRRSSASGSRPPRPGRRCPRSSRSASLTSRASRTLLAFLVAVDVGHYYGEPGVISASGRAEFEYNLELASQLKGLLNEVGLKVRMIGERGDYAILHYRTRDAAGANLFLSVHHDSVRLSQLPHAHRFAGFSLFVSRRNPQADKSLACASAIGARLRAAGFTPSRYHADPVLGENRPFADEINGVHYYDNLTVARSSRSVAGAWKPARDDERARPRAPRRRGDRGFALGRHHAGAHRHFRQGGRGLPVDPCRSQPRAVLAFRRHHRARLSHAVAALAPVGDDLFLQRPAHGRQLRAQPRALHLAGAKRLARTRALHALEVREARRQRRAGHLERGDRARGLGQAGARRRMDRPALLLNQGQTTFYETALEAATSWLQLGRVRPR